MNTGLDQGSAGITQFPAGVRGGSPGDAAGETSTATDVTTSQVMTADCSDSWYPRRGHRGSQAGTGSLMPARCWSSAPESPGAVRKIEKGSKRNVSTLSRQLAQAVTGLGARA